eukprot:1119049-Pleurochrysis_carterae.AAC.1
MTMLQTWRWRKTKKTDALLSGQLEPRPPLPPLGPHHPDMLRPEKEQRLKDHFKALETLANRVHACGNCKEVGINHGVLASGWSPGDVGTLPTY